LEFISIKLRLNKDLLKLHITVFIWGFTAILGQLISKSALILVWYRVLIASISLLLFLGIKKTAFKISWKKGIRYLGIGSLVSLHWVFFYESIKVSKISVALVALSSITLFTGILDPLFNHRKPSWLDIAVGLLIMSGILLIFKFESQYSLGTLLGIIAGLLASLFTIFNSWEAKNSDTVLTSFYELSGGFVFLSLFLFLNKNLNLDSLKLYPSDIIYLLLLGIICTALAYVMAFAVMKTISPFTVNLVTSLEPVYGIILALIIFGKTEALNSGFYIGALIILGAVFLHPIFQRIIHKKMGKPGESISLETENIIP
jgi:drug/metabolite transporter (DMT)-like permease